MKKILIIQSGATPVQFEAIMRRLSEKGRTLLIWSQKARRDASTERFIIRRHWSMSRLATFWDFILFTLASPFFLIFWFLRCLIARFRGFSVVILTGLPEKLLLTPWLKLLGCKVIWVQSEFLPSSFRINWYSLAFRLWSRLTIFVCGSEAISEDILLTYRLKGRPLTVIPSFIEEAGNQESIFDSFADEEIKRKHQDFFIIGYVGGFERESGIEFLIKATEHFNNLIHSYQIVLVGDGPEKKQLLWLVKLMGLERQVRFVGNQIEITKWLEHFDVLVVPQITRETFHMTTLKAMSVGLPVIGTDVPGVRELISQQGGVLIPPQKTEPLAEAIYALYQDQALYQKTAQGAKDRVRNHYRFEAVLATWEKILN